MSPRLQRIFPALYLLGCLSLLQCPPVLCDCDSPPIIAHGRHKQVQTYSLFKTEVAYECDRGYTLVGPARLSCSASHWSPEAPQCKAVCVKPEIANGRLTVIKNQYSELDTVTVQCNPGYGLVGSPNITCSESRTWYPEVPRCEWGIPGGCEQVLVGRALPNPEDVKLALEVYKLSLEVELLERQRDNTKRSTP
ncbi:C4b-binding protein alpha chain [Manis javanica]|nr:C4b-binding protein alpha chain [Manis javanica]